MVLAVALLAPGRAAAAEGGIDLVPDPLITLILVLGFALLVVPLDRLLFRPLFRVLDERAERIEGARGRASELQAEADAVLSRYEHEVAATREQAARERRERMAKARAEELEATGKARSEAEERLERARAEVGHALEQARGDLRSQAQELAREAAHRILGRPVS